MVNHYYNDYFPSKNLDCWIMSRKQTVVGVAIQSHPAKVLIFYFFPQQGHFQAVSKQVIK